MTLQTLKTQVEEYFEIDLSKRIRKGNYVFARRTYFKLATELFHPQITHDDIGKSINRRHCTVLYHIHKKMTFKEQNRFKAFRETLFPKENKQVVTPKELLEKLSQLNETQLENVLERFMLIADMELKKKY